MRRAAAIALALLVARPAAAESDGGGGGGDPSSGPLRLRGEVFVAAEPPVGLLMLEGLEKGRDWLTVEAMVWTGADSLRERGDGDALVALIRLRDPGGRGDARLGRFVVSGGAIRPLHIDGVAVHGRHRRGTDAEVFAGIPVVPRLGADQFDWVAGARIGQRLGRIATAGVSYYHQRDRGYLADEEVGVDVAATPVRWLDVAARAAYDTVNPGLADAHLSAAARRGRWRVEAFGVRRSPSRLLPATSLFAVLGDVASDELGAGARWRAAPRLDVWGSAGLLATGDDLGADLSARAQLRLDERGDGAVGVELRRRGVDPISSWTGVRGTVRVPLGCRLSAASELELVVPDEGGDRGSAWPWGLVALAWQPSPAWTTSAAIEGRSSPEHRRAVSAMFQLARRWEGP